MKLSDGEKLILLMLSDIYEEAGIEGEIDPDFIKSSIFRDHLWGIPWRYSGIPFDDQENPPIVKEVVDILEMWSFIERGYKELTDKQKQQLEKDVENFGKDPKFRGFDGNNESEYMSVASYIINDLERFEEFKERGLNSHMPSIITYKRMLSVFHPIRNNLMMEGLSLQDLTSILKARIHPDSR